MHVYIYNADIFCTECGNEYAQELQDNNVKDTGDSDEFPQGPYSNGGGEADTPQHCGNCGLFLENPLTEDGTSYVADAAKRSGRAVGPNGYLETPGEWLAFYDYIEAPPV